MGAVAPFGRHPGQMETGAICPVCGKAFTGDKFKFRLGRHMIIHTGEKPYSCPMCPYRGNIRSNLTRHLALQHGQTSLNTVSRTAQQNMNIVSASSSVAYESLLNVHDIQSEECTSNERKLNS